MNQTVTDNSRYKRRIVLTRTKRKSRAMSKEENDMLRMNESATRLEDLQLSNQANLYQTKYSFLLLFYRFFASFISFKYYFPLSPISPFHVDIVRTDVCISEITFQLLGLHVNRTLMARPVYTS